jgi:xanthine/uracil permease
MKLKIGWVLFALLQLASWGVHRKAWMTTWWDEAQLWLGVASIVLAIPLLVRGGGTRRARVFAVLVGLLVGQWHLWSSWLTVLLWRHKGFAP